MSRAAPAPQGAMSDAERKLRNARSVVVQANSFFGRLLLAQRVVEVTDGSVTTCATDGDHLYFNPEWVLAQPADQLQGTCVHEALHPAFCHHLRRGHRDAHLWNMAADYVINPIVLDAKFRLPEGALYRDDMRGLTAEQAYAKLVSEQPPPPPPEQPDESDDDDGDDDEGEGEGEGEGGGEGEGEGRPNAPGDGDGDGQGEAQGDGDDGSGEPTPDVGGTGWLMDAPEAKASPAERQAAEAQWKQRLATAQLAASDDIPGSLQEAIDKLLDPRADWRDLLRRYMTKLARSDYSWRQPNRRFVSDGLYLPSLQGETCGRVAFIGDLSGSMPREALPQALSEVAAICSEIRPEGLDVMFFDTYPRAEASYEVGEEPDTNATVSAGGGTLFVPAFEWLQRKLDEGNEYSVVIFFTDLYPNDSWHSIERAAPVDVPVLWLDYCDGKVVPPFGDECVRMPREVPR